MLTIIRFNKKDLEEDLDPESKNRSKPSGEPSKTPFKRLFCYDEENDLVKVNKTPNEKKSYGLGLVQNAPEESPLSYENISVPKRKLLFHNLKGKA